MSTLLVSAVSAPSSPASSSSSSGAVITDENSSSASRPFQRNVGHCLCAQEGVVVVVTPHSTRPAATTASTTTTTPTTTSTTPISSASSAPKKMGPRERDSQELSEDSGLAQSLTSEHKPRENKVVHSPFTLHHHLQYQHHHHHHSQDHLQLQQQQQQPLLQHQQHQPQQQQQQQACQQPEQKLSPGAMKSQPQKIGTLKSFRSGEQQRLRRHGSSQSAKSATTIRSITGSTRLSTDASIPRRHHGNRHWTTNLEEPHTEDDEDKVSGVPGLNERELWSLHKAVPGLRRHDPRTSTIRQHYYPEGGWGWLVVGAAFLVQVLTTGFQLAFGVFALQFTRRFGRSALMDSVWVGVVCLASSFLWSPIIVAVCRRKSTRLMAVLGGLVLALATLFTSFAHQVHQTFFSYGLLLGLGMAMVRETSTLMVGQYFKRRRAFVEIVIHIGSGIGVILFAVFFQEVLSQMGWRLGLQACTGLLLAAFFLGMFYRSASLYHPQRRAILHLKTQRKKVKAKGKPSNDRPPYFDFSVLKLSSLQIVLLSAGVAAMGTYTPLFYLTLQSEEEGLGSGQILLLHTFLGLALATGSVAFGLLVVRPSPQCLISVQYLCQASLFGIGISCLALTAVEGYHGYVLFTWFYGVCLGGYQYTLELYTLETVRARRFARAWGFVQGVRAVPILLGIPITGYINQNHSKAGYYFSAVFTLVGSALLFLNQVPSKEPVTHYRSNSCRSLEAIEVLEAVDEEGERERVGDELDAEEEDDEEVEEEDEEEEINQQQNGLVELDRSPNANVTNPGTVHQGICTCQRRRTAELPTKRKANALSWTRIVWGRGKHVLQLKRKKNQVRHKMNFYMMGRRSGDNYRPELLNCISEERLIGNHQNHGNGDPFQGRIDAHREQGAFLETCLQSCPNMDKCYCYNSCAECNPPVMDVLVATGTERRPGGYGAATEGKTSTGTMETSHRNPQRQRRRRPETRAEEGIPALPASVLMNARNWNVSVPDGLSRPPPDRPVLKRQHTWHDITVIEQITTSV